MHRWPLLLPTFGLLFFFFSSLRLLLLTHFGEIPVCEDIYKKKYLFLVILILLRKKADFRAFFRLFTASVRSQPPGPPAVPGVFKLVSLLFDTPNTNLYKNILGIYRPLTRYILRLKNRRADMGSIPVTSSLQIRKFFSVHFADK